MADQALSVESWRWVMMQERRRVSSVICVRKEGRKEGNLELQIHFGSSYQLTSRPIIGGTTYMYGVECSMSS